MEEKLSLRKSIKSKKPNFIRTDSFKRKKLGTKWRRPKGLQNKMRLRKKGYHRTVKIGYSSPSAVKGLHRSGLKEIIVCSIKDLNPINPEKEGAVISRTVGLKKKVDLIKKAKEKNITILNVKDAEKFINAVEEKILKKKESKEKSDKEKEEKKKEKEKKAKDKDTEEKKDEEKGEDKLAEKIEEEQKKEDLEKKKVLTKKGVDVV